MTWPLLFRAGDHVLEAIYYWDAYTNAMIMGGRVDALLGRGPLSLYENYFFAPLPNAIAFNENLFGLSLVFAPFYLASSNPLWAYNLTLLTSLALSVFFTYLLVRRLTDSFHAGLLAGVTFAFCPYVMFELGRIQLVATQWIPLCVLLLHRAIEERKRRDAALLWVAFLLQVGTCLYYAMFLVPLLALLGGVLVYRERPPRRLLLELAGGGVLSAIVALLMVHPYFSLRDAFALERSPTFASSYDGKFGFFLNVHETNHTLRALHHRAEYRGAHEEIAFPGFLTGALVLFSLAAPLLGALRVGARSVGVVALRWLAVLLLGALATLLLHSFLAGAVVFALGSAWQTKSGMLFPFSGSRGLYFGLLLFAVSLFLGLFPCEWRGEPVRGLYYYLYSYFPGFDGIRKVSRQAVMTTLAFVLLASFGAAWLFARVKGERGKALLCCGLLGITVFELRTFPHAVHREWAAPRVPEVYRFVAAQPERDLVAAVPQHDGVQRFRGDMGRALHNYLMVLHKHRSLNGQSSYVLPVTDLVERVSNHLPEEGTRRVLAALGARHVVVHAGDLHPSRRDWPVRLGADSEHYVRAFQSGEDYVFSLVESSDPSLHLVPVPAIPGDAELVPSAGLRARGIVKSQYAHKSLDGHADTYWPGPEGQARGQWYELSSSEPRRVVAIEFENRQHQNHLPLSYQIQVANGQEPLRTVLDRPTVRLFHEQVFSPKTYVWRVVLPEPVLADRVRVVVGQPLPGHGFWVHEARLWVSKAP